MKEKIGSDLQLAELKKDRLWKAYEQAHVHASSVLQLTLQWKDLEDHLESIRKSVEKGLEEVLSQDKRLDEAQRVVEEREHQVELKEKKVNQEVLMKERQLALVQKRIEECSMELNLKDKQLGMMEERLELVEMSLEKCFRKVESKEKELFSVEKLLEDRSKELESREAKLGRVQNLLKERSKQLDLRDDQVARVQRLLEEKSRELDLKEDKVGRVERLLEVCTGELTSKEGELGKVQQLLGQVSADLSLKEEQLNTLQKSLDERSGQLRLKDEELAEVQKLYEKQTKEVALRTKQLGELDQEVVLKKRALGAIRTLTQKKSTELQSMEENIDSIKKLIQESNDELQNKKKERDELQNSIEELSQKSILKNKEYDLLTKSTDELRAQILLKQRECELLEKSLADLRSEEKNFELNRKDVEKLCAELKSKEKEYELNRKLLEEPSADSESGEKKLDSMVKLLNSLSKELEGKREQLDSIKIMMTKYCEDTELKERELKAIQRSIEEHNEELKTKEKQLQSIQISIQEKEKELDQKKDEHDSILRSMSGSSKELESKQLNSVQKSLREQSYELESKVKELELKENNLDSIRKMIEECSASLEIKEKKFEEYVKEFKLKETQFELTQKSFEERVKEVELKEKILSTVRNSPVKNLQPRDLLLNSTIDAYASPESFAAIDGKTLQLFVNEHLSRHDLVRSAISAAFSGSSDPAMLVLDAMQGFYPHSGEGGLEFDSIIIKRSCILLLEHLLRFSPHIKPQVREEATKVAHEWKARMRVEHNSLDVLAFLQLLATYGLADVFDREELKSHLDMVSKHRQFSELRQAFGFAKLATESSITCTKIKMEEPEKVLIHNAIVSSSKVPQPSASAILLSFLKDCSDAHNLTATEILDALETTLDPALVVLDVIKRSCPQQWENGLRNLNESAIGRYILLLEQLMKASTPITSYIKEEAEKLAAKWKEKLRDGTSYSLKVLLFLHLLAAYGIIHSFDGDEILKLFLAVAHHRKAPELVRVVGFAIKMSDFIQSLIGRKQNLEAIAYIYAFQLVDQFSPVFLLQKYMQNVKKSVKGIRRKGNKELAIDKEVDALRAVGKCMSDYKIEFKPLSNLIEKRIKELQREKGNERTSEAAGVKDHVQQLSVDIAASHVAEVQLQQKTAQITAPSASKGHSQQHSCHKAATSAAGVRVQRKRAWANTWVSKDYAKQRSSNVAASPAAKVMKQEGVDGTTALASMDPAKQLAISNATVPVTDAKLLSEIVKKESTSTSAFKDRVEQSSHVVAPPPVDNCQLRQQGLADTVNSAFKNQSQQQTVSNRANPTTDFKRQPKGVKRDHAKCSSASKAHSEWRRSYKRHKINGAPRHRTLVMSPDSNPYMSSSALQRHIPSVAVNEDVPHYGLPQYPHAHYDDGVSWPNRPPSRQCFPPSWNRR